MFDLLVRSGDPQSLHIAIDFVGHSNQKGRRSDATEREAMWRALEASAPAEDRAGYCGREFRHCFGYALQLLTIASIDPRMTEVNYGFVKSKVRGHTTLETPPTIVLCFVLAIVVGYFAGRLMTIRERMRSDRDY